MDKKQLKILEELVASEPIEFNPYCSDDLSSESNIPKDYSYLDALKNYKPVSEEDLSLFEKKYGVEFSHIKKVMDRVEKDGDKLREKSSKKIREKVIEDNEWDKNTDAQYGEGRKLINPEEEYSQLK